MDEHKPERAPAERGPRRWLFTYMLLAAMGVILLNEYLYVSQHLADIPYSEFLKQTESGNVTSVSLSDNRAFGELKKPADGQPKEFVSNIPANDPNLIPLLEHHGVSIRVQARSPLWSFVSSWLLPVILFYAIWAFVFRRMAGGSPGNLMGLGRSRAKIFVERDTGTRFDDVAGCDEAKSELQELVNFLRNPKQYTRLGGRAPKGILLVGPPGTGKTMLARAVAGQAKVPFFSINGSEFVEMFVGLGAARVRDLFQQARAQAPCIIFIDEIDALGRSRVLGGMGGSVNDEKEQTLNQLLAEMDGFDSTTGVILLAATNRPEILDPALLRAGRFDRQILVSLPDREGRREILQVHARKVPLEEGVDLDRVAAMTPGFSGADLANLVNEAALTATRRNADKVSERDFTRAIERLVAGLEQKRKVMNPEEKRRIAFHEMGHATVALSRDAADRVHKISIVARGMGALGYTLQRPTEDRYLMDQEEIFHKIAVLLGGRASEMLFFDAVSTGAADDLTKATDLARAMVTQYGMSEELGLATFKQRGSPFLQNAYLQERHPFSERTAQTIDDEVRGILSRALRLAHDSLDVNRNFIERGAAKLLEAETLEEDEVQKLWAELGTPVEEKLRVA